VGLHSEPPWWAYVLAGWLLAAPHLALRAPGPDPRALRARMPAGALATDELDPDRMSPRALRGLPAIGPTRALAIARARWELGLLGGPESWEAIPGIGPETVRAIRDALAARKAAGTTPEPGPWCAPAARP
jgi:hypothetical protein